MKSLSGSETSGLKQMEEQALISPRVDLAEYLITIDALARHLVDVDAPHSGHVGAVFGVLDIAGAGQEVAFLAVLAPALAVALAGDRGVAATRPADAPGGQHDIDGPQQFCTPWLWCSMPRACMRKLVFAVPHHSAALPDGPLGDAGDLGRSPRGPLLDLRSRLLEADRMLLDELVIEPVVFDHEVQNALKQSDVAAGLDGQEEVAGARQRGDPRIDDDDPGAPARGPAIRSWW